MLLGWLFSLYVGLRVRYENTYLGGLFTRVKWFPFSLILKIGRADVALEADTLRFIRDHTSIPVPRVIASATRGKYAFTLMEEIEGLPLDIVWRTLDTSQRALVVSQLRDIVGQLRRIPPPPGVKIGSLRGKAYRDSRVSSCYPFGPFETEGVFLDRLVEATDSFLERGLSQPIRERMRDDHRIVFTHGDLAPRNIMIRGHTVAAILDWEESGWMPEHWELVKARWNTGMGKDSGWNDALWEILSRDNEGDWLIDKELSDKMVGAI